MLFLSPKTQESHGCLTEPCLAEALRFLRLCMTGCPVSYPPANFCENSRLMGRRCPGGRLLEIYTTPPPAEKSTGNTVICAVRRNFHNTINIYTPDICPPSWFCCHDSSCIVPASWIHPRTVSHPHGAARHGLPQMPSPVCPDPDIGHTTDVLSGTCFLPCAIGCHTLARKETSCHCGAVPDAPHNIHPLSTPGIPDAYMVSSAFSASHHHFLTPP